ncbi:MAG: DUF3243 family protein [Bacillota bacterium]
MDLNGIESFSDWDKWKQTIAKAVNVGEAVGLSEESVEKIGFRLGNILSAAVDPENREQRVLQELWRAGDDDDRKTLTKMIVKMSQTDDK